MVLWRPVGEYSSWGDVETKVGIVLALMMQKFLKKQA